MLPADETVGSCRRFLIAVLLFGHVVFELRSAFSYTTHDRQNGAAALGGHSSGMEYLHGILSGSATSWLCLCPCVSHMDGNPPACRSSLGTPDPAVRRFAARHSQLLDTPRR